MYGYIRASTCKLSNADRDVYRKLYCGQCGALHSLFGYLSRTTVSYDAAAVGLLVSAQQTSEPTDSRYWCAVAPRRLNIFSERELPQVVAACFSVLLLQIKLADSRQERPRSVSNVAYKLFRRRFAKANSILGKLGFPKRHIDDALEEQRHIESSQSRSIDEYAAPTGVFVGNMFRFTAELTQRSENSDLLFDIGTKLGSLIYLVDSFVDLLEDIENNRFNGFIASYGEDPITLERAGRRELSEKSTNYLLTVNTALRSLVTLRHEEILGNILSTGVPHHVSAKAQIELRKLGNHRASGLSGVHRGLLGSLLCLASADAAAGQFGWGQTIADSTTPCGDFTAYGYVCHSDCLICDAADCVCNPFHFRIYERSDQTCVTCCLQLPKAAVDLSVVGVAGGWIATIFKDAAEERARKAKRDAQNRAMRASRRQKLQSEAGKVVDDIRGLGPFVDKHVDEAAGHMEDGASELFWGEIQEAVRGLAIVEAGLDRINDIAFEYKKIPDQPDTLPPPFDKATLVPIRGWVEQTPVLSMVEREVTSAGNLWVWGWEDPLWDSWKPAEDHPKLLRFGLQTPVVGLTIPAVTRFPTGRPLLIQIDGARRDQTIGGIQSIIARLLATIPPGKLRFTFIDPVGHGQNVAAFMPLADHEETLVTSRAWSEPEHIDNRLKELTEHVENVIQKYLRAQYDTIEEYNREAREIAEPYRVLVVFDFPENFTEASSRRLVSLVQNGPRCGVYPIILQDVSKPLPYGFSVEDLCHSTTNVRYADRHFVWSEYAPAQKSGMAVNRSGEKPSVDVEVGKTYQGTVSSIEDFGAFVNILPGRVGLLHISQISEERVQEVSDEFSEGDIVRVKVMEVDAEGRIRLTIKGIDQNADAAPRYEEPSPSEWKAFSLEFDRPCPPELLSRIIKEVGEAAKENMTVVVPYAKVLSLAGLDPEHPRGWWKADGMPAGEEASSAGSVEIPLGPMGARKAQLLTLGKGTAHHALIAGRTGSGKSNLLHVIITTLAVKYSPREIELYLVDFKKGVEFKSYANHGLPHARVIAIESEREFGLSVLQGLDAEMQRRGESFRSVAANDIAEYRGKVHEQLPRIILIVDEFQEFFSEDDAIAQQAGRILDRLVRQGRSFGIHVLLGSQSLSGSYTLARSTLDQMQIRIALPCSEADSRLILADDNPAARLLSRPGEAIYNASSGLVEGNQIFQVALFSDEDREHYLQAIAQKGAEEQRQPIVFEGHEPAELEACGPLAGRLTAPDWPPPAKATDVWIGEPVAIKAPTSVRFRRQGGANLLVVTRDEEEGVGVLTACALSLVAQHSPDTARIYIADLATADAPWADLAGDLADLLPHPIEVLGRRDIPGLLEELGAEIQRRIDDEQNAKAWSGYLIIQGLQRARDLRLDPAKGYSFGEEETKASPSEQFATLLREGPEVGIHTLVWCDTYVNVDRTLESRALIEFGYRVAGTMSQDDSMRLLDDAAASRLDRPHRMIKYDEDQVGVLEKFRPYRLPATAWLEHVAEILRDRQPHR